MEYGISKPRLSVVDLIQRPPKECFWLVFQGGSNIPTVYLIGSGRV